METNPADLFTQAEAHLNQAELYYQQEKYDDSLRECDTALGIDPALADAHNLRGVILEELGREWEAISAYRQALQLDPDFHEAKNNLATLKSDLVAQGGLITIATFGYPTEAYLSKAKLAAEGIESFVADEMMTTWLYPTTTGGVRLQVREADMEQALEVLSQEAEAIELTAAEFDEEEDSLG